MIDCSLPYYDILVLLVDTNISEEDAVFIFRVELSMVRIKMVKKGSLKFMRGGKEMMYRNYKSRK